MSKFDSRTAHPYRRRPDTQAIVGGIKSSADESTLFSLRRRRNCTDYALSFRETDYSSINATTNAAKIGPCPRPGRWSCGLADLQEAFTVTCRLHRQATSVSVRRRIIRFRKLREGRVTVPACDKWTFDAAG